MSKRKRRCEAETSEFRRPPLGLRKYVNGELVSATVRTPAICRCGDQAGVALKIIRHAFENRFSAKIHIRTSPDRPARARNQP
jgi:hypothetical protein